MNSLSGRTGGENTVFRIAIRVKNVPRNARERLERLVYNLGQSPRAVSWIGDTTFYSIRREEPLDKKWLQEAFRSIRKLVGNDQTDHAIEIQEYQIIEEDPTTFTSTEDGQLFMDGVPVEDLEVANG